MEENDFSFEILTEDTQSSEELSPFGEQTASQEEVIEGKDKETTITEVNPESIFETNAEDKPENVGDEEDTELEDSTSEKKGSSPSVYSSIATALKEDGVLDLDDEDIKKIIEPEDFAEAIQKQVDKKLDQTQLSIKEALDYGVEPSDIKTYQNTINYLNSIEEDTLSDETDKGETLRKQLIYQDFINRGFTEERANKEVDKSIKSGTDLEDAKEALQSNISYFEESYNDLKQQAKKNTEDLQKEQTQQVNNLKKTIIETEEPFEGVKIDKNQRIKIYETLTKGVFKTDSGQMLTEIQKFEKENPIEFKQKLATLFVLTDGFKKLDNVIKGKLKQETKKGLRELEHIIKNTPTYGNGKLNLANSYEDKQSYKGMKLDV